MLPPLEPPRHKSPIARVTVLRPRPAQDVVATVATDDDTVVTPPLDSHRIADPGAMLTTDAPHVDFVLPGLPIAKTGILAGAGGGGKSWLTLEILVGLALGWTWPWPADIGWRPEPASVAYLTAEEDAADIHRRLRTIGRYHNAALGAQEIERLSANLHIYPLVGHHLTTREFGEPGPGPLAAQIGREWEADQHRLIVVDPLSAFAPGAEVDTPGAAALIATTTSLARELHAAILMVHHSSQQAILGRDTGQTAARGATALVDGQRWVGVLTPAFDPDEAERAGMDEIERHQWVRLSLPKATHAARIRDVTFRREIGEHGGILEPAPLPDLATTRRSNRRESI